MNEVGFEILARTPVPQLPYVTHTHTHARARASVHSAIADIGLRKFSVYLISVLAYLG